jgi:hypothetical protein
MDNTTTGSEGPLLLPIANGGKCKSMPKGQPLPAMSRRRHNNFTTNYAWKPSRKTQAPGGEVVGKPDEGKPHVRFDVAGDGNPAMIWIMRHSQRKRRVTARPDLTLGAIL